MINEESMNLDPLLDTRLKRIRKRIKTNLDEVIDRSKIDENRFEQEVLFYIEKTDVQPSGQKESLKIFKSR